MGGWVATIYYRCLHIPFIFSKIFYPSSSEGGVAIKAIHPGNRYSCLSCIKLKVCDWIRSSYMHVCMCMEKDYTITIIAREAIM